MELLGQLLSATTGFVALLGSGLAFEQGKFGATNSERWAQTRGILLLMSLWIWLQACPASSQTTDLERYQKGPATSGAAELERTTRELRSLDSASQTTHQERYQKALADFRAGKLEQAVRELTVSRFRRRP